VCRDVLEAQLRQEDLLHRPIETFVRAIPLRVLFSAHNNVAANLVLVVQTLDPAGLSEWAAGNRCSIAPELLALAAFTVGSTVQPWQARPKVTLEIIPEEAREYLQRPACMSCLDDIGVARLQHARALGKGPRVDGNVTGAVAHQVDMPLNLSFLVDPELPLVAFVS